MSNTKMYSLSFLPIENLNLNNLEEDLKFKDQLAGSILIADNINMINNHIKNLNKLLNKTDLIIEDLNKVLESYLYILLITNTITDLKKENETNHYKKFDLLNIPRDLPSSDWFKKINYTNQKTWFGPYGSILYQLKDEINIYRNPSQLINRSFTKFINNLEISNLTRNNILNYLKDDTEKIDYLLYKQPIKIIEDLGFLDILKKLNDIEDWLIKVYKNESSNELIQCFIENGLYADNIKALSYKFIHQDLSSIELECLNSLIENLKVYEDKTNIYYLELLDILGLSLPNNWFTKISIDILNSLAKPGGFNYLIINFAALLLNRAYCLTHYSYTDKSNVLLEDINSITSKEISRVARLLYYCSYLLKQSNLSHLRIYGNNINNLLKIEQLPLRITNILL